jgi:hypothetical protein
MPDANGAHLYSDFNDRMIQLGIVLNKFVGLNDVLDAWPSNPKGFHFKCTHLEFFKSSIAQSQNFAREHWLFEKFEGIKPPNCAFREVGNQGSLHIIFRFDQPSIIHLDSIAIVEARDRVTGQAIYVEDIGLMIEHRRVDMKHDKCFAYCK